VGAGGQININFYPEDFPQYVATAPKYQRFKVLSCSWHFYCQESVPFSTSNGNIVRPSLIYSVPTTSNSVPARNVDAYNNYGNCSSWVFNKDFEGSVAPYSPKDGLLTSKG